MIWLTWRQFRAQAIAAMGSLAVIGITLAITGVQLMHLYDINGVGSCQAHSDCLRLSSSFLTQARASSGYGVFFYGGILVLFASPAVIGVFWGAPLVSREIEAGTFRLAWSQSVTRTRWLAVKLGLIGLAAMATTGLLSLMISWWASPIDKAIGLAATRNGTYGLQRFAPVLFGARGITPIGYAAFGFALGVTIGVLIRRTVPAMAITLAVFAGALVSMAQWIRPHLIAPLHVTFPLASANITGWSTDSYGQMTVTGGEHLAGAWVLANQTLNASGHLFTGPATPACISGSTEACDASLGKLHLRQLLTYQPSSRYWVFQGYETAIFLALGLVLAAFCLWWVRRRRLS